MPLDEIPKKKANYVLWALLASLFVNLIFIALISGAGEGSMECTLQSPNGEIFVEDTYYCTQDLGLNVLTVVFWCGLSYILGIITLFLFFPRERRLLSPQDVVDIINEMERPPQIYLVGDFNWEHITEGRAVFELKKDTRRRAYLFGVQPHPTNPKEWMYTWLGAIPSTIKEIRQNIENSDVLKQSVIKSQEKAFEMDKIKKLSQQYEDAEEQE